MGHVRDGSAPPCHLRRGGCGNHPGRRRAGNSAKNAGNFVPAAYPEVISVSALSDFDGKRGALAGCGFVTDIFWFE